MYSTVIEFSKEISDEELGRLKKRQMRHLTAKWSVWTMLARKNM